MNLLAKDSRELETTGALWGFVNPSSRLNMLATCQGSVQLSYFDKDSRMHQIEYDATSDSRNNRFQQWLPSNLRTCINFNKSQSSLLLKGKNQLVFHGESTIEAWVSFPLTDLADMSENEENHEKSWRCLAGSEDGKEGYIVTEFDPRTDTEYLGITVDDTFQSSDYDVKNLRDGWHHIAAVSTEITTIFYIDGAQVSSYPLAAKLAKVKKMKYASSPKIQLLINARQRLIRAKSSNNEEAIKRNTKKIAKLEKKLTVEEKENADKISGAIKNASAKQPRKNIATLGGAKDKKPFGKVAELRIWSTALPAEEIEINSKTLLNGNEPDLLAYYPMDEATGSEVKDQTGKLHNGTVTGLIWSGCAAPIGLDAHKSVNAIAFDGLKFDGIKDYKELYKKQIENPNTPEVRPNTMLRKRRKQIEKPNTPEVRPNNTPIDFTIELWVKTVMTSDGDPCLISNKDWGKGSYKGFALFIKKGICQFNIGDGRNREDLIIGEINDGKWHHINVTIARGSYIIGYLNGVKTNKVSSKGLDKIITNYPLNAGQDGTKNYKYWFKGELAGIELSEGARAPEDVMARASILVPDSMISCEYSTLNVDEKTGRKVSMMRRCLVYPSKSGIISMADKRIEALELVWVGNTQFAPTLLGYIEGAPPIPSENLTMNSNYNGATSVKLTSSEDVAYSWNRTDNRGVGAKVETFEGTEGKTIAGGGLGVLLLEEVEKHKIGVKAQMTTGWKSLSTSNISAKSAIRMNDSLSLRGNQEKQAKFPDLGKRFIPKNVGYALVVSATADVFITRLSRSKKMVGQPSVVPVADIPPDINTITFLINPAYTMAGSLDGLTGSKATSNRFFEHVPEMRAQYGSQYPASFFRLQEAYDLKQQIIREDKRRESYFINFNSQLTDDLSLDRESNKGSEPTLIGLHKDGVKAVEKNDKKEKKKRALIAKANLSSTSKKAKEKSKQIQTLLADQKKRTEAQGGLSLLSKRMEAIQIRAGKHNIVNNYVWDADGGLRVEAESFANSASYMVGGSSQTNVQVGGLAHVEAAEIRSDLTVQATMTLTQTMTKTQNHTNGFGLDVNLNGVESRGVTDHDDYPLNPGEKVDRYRFMSYYLEGSTKNFMDFFEYVVDPEWLASNDEEARALRQANGKANKTWRVLHRVTYVERPALMGFGRDLRPLKKATDRLSDTELIKKQMEELNKKLDNITNALKNKS